MTHRLLEIQNEEQELFARLLALSQEREAILTGEVRTDQEQTDFSMFKDTTRRLLTNLWDAPDKMLSHEDIREDVMFDPEAPDRNIRRTINRARKALREKNSRYAIKNIKGKGYQLIRGETLPNVTNLSKTPQKPQKKRGNVR
jgi:DNA-binding winged helix-turn-helix (wHTH) protein